MISWMRLNIYTNSNLITNTSVYFGSFEIKLAHTITSLYYGSFDKWFSNCKNTILHLEITTRSTITYTVIISFRVYFLFLGLKDQFLGEWAQLWLKNIVFWNLWLFQWNPNDMLRANFHHHHMVVLIWTLFLKPLLDSIKSVQSFSIFCEFFLKLKPGENDQFFWNQLQKISGFRTKIWAKIAKMVSHSTWWGYTGNFPHEGDSPCRLTYHHLWLMVV